MKTTFNKSRGITLREAKGFTLIELLVVIGILAILLSIVLIAINPARQFAQANNTKRRSDVIAILNAISQYAADNKGVLPPAVAGLTAGGAAVEIASGAGNADICTDLIVTVQYLPALPADPQGPGNGAQITSCASYDTGYQIQRDANNRVTVETNPTYEQLSQHIAVTR